MRRSLVYATLALASFSNAQTPWTLGQCLARAEEKNLDILNAAFDLDLADRNKDRTYWDLLPNLNGGATHGYNYGRVVDRFTNTFATDRVRTNNFFLSGQFDLFQGFSKQNSIKQAGMDADAATQGLENAQNNVRLTVVQAFLDILGLKERMTAAEVQAANTREQIELTTELVDAGRLARAELLSLEAQLAQEEFNVVDLDAQKDQRTLALGRALQLDAEVLRGFEVEAPRIEAAAILQPTRSMEEVLTNVLANNPGYAQAALQVESAEKGIGIARAGGMPSLNLTGSVGTGFSGRDFRQVGEPIVGAPIPIGATSGGELVFTPNINYATEVTPFSEQLDQNLNQSVGFTLNVPIFNNMRNNFAVQQARVNHEKQKIQLTNVHNNLQQDVLSAMVQQRSAYRQYLAAAKAVEAGELAMEYAQERFSQGVITSLELNTAKTSVNRSQADLINAKYQYLMSIKFLDILQGLPVTL